jgi:hypothetical protein
MRVSKVEAWSTSTYSLTGTTVGPGYQQIMSLTDPISQSVFQDSNAAGVDYVHIGMKFSLESIQNWTSTSTPTPLLDVQILTNGPVGTSLTGWTTMDFTVDFR